MAAPPKPVSWFAQVVEAVDTPENRKVAWDLFKNFAIFAGSVIIFRSGILDSVLVDTTPVQSPTHNNDYPILRGDPYPRPIRRNTEEQQLSEGSRFLREVGDTEEHSMDHHQAQIEMLEELRETNPAEYERQSAIFYGQIRGDQLDGGAQFRAGARRRE